jgi:hypothetical protein
MADADIVRATIAKAHGGFSVAVVLRRGERMDMWGVSFVDNFDKAETVARVFAATHGMPWEKVDVVSR